MAGVVRRDGLREEVSACADALRRWNGDDGSLVVDAIARRLDKIAADLAAVLDAVPDVPPDPPAAAPCVIGASLYLRDLDEPVALRVEWLLRDGRQGFAEFSDG